MNQKICLAFISFLATVSCKSQMSNLQDVNPEYHEQFRSCVAKQKQEMAAHTTLPHMQEYLESESKVQQTITDGKISDETFVKHFVLQSNIVNQSVDYKLTQAELSVEVDDNLGVLKEEISTEEGLKTSLLQRDITYKLLENGRPLFVKEVIFRVQYDKDCSLVPAELLSINYNASVGDNLNFAYVKTNLLNKEVISQGTGTTDLTAFTNLRRIEKNEQLHPGLTLPVIIGYTKGSVAINSVRPANVVDQAGSQISATIISFNMSLSGTSIESNLTLMADGYYRLSLQGLQTHESISRKEWVRISLAEQPQTTKGQAENFSFADFDDPYLSYKIHSDYELAFDNFDAYFVIEPGQPERSKFLYQVSGQKPRAPEGIEMPVPERVDAKYQKYLKGSRYINITDPRVARMADDIRDRVGNRSQALVIFEILTEVNNKITYDYDSLAQYNINVASVTDTLDKGTGVCQHFAALFAAISRRLGIPARIIVGNTLSYDFEKGEAVVGYHAWNEILINGNQWLPIEPQSQSYYLRQPATYFPSGEYTLYDQSNDAGESDHQASVIAMNLIFEGPSEFDQSAVGYYESGEIHSEPPTDQHYSPDEANAYPSAGDHENVHMQSEGGNRSRATGN